MLSDLTNIQWHEASRGLSATADERFCGLTPSFVFVSIVSTTKYVGIPSRIHSTSKSSVNNLWPTFGGYALTGEGG